MGKIFSPGKLLLTSEYFVLDGALALAVPTQQVQDFFYEEQSNSQSLIYWEAFHQNEIWLKATIDYKNWTVTETNIPEAAQFICKVLKNVQQLSSVKFHGTDTYFLTTHLQFPANFGLGSSSTLMNNLAEWARIDAFLLNEVSLGGSGYDVAVAREKSAVLYQKNDGGNIVKRIDYSPSFRKQLIFIHLNQKQDSREGIQLYTSKTKSQNIINQFSELTNEVLLCDDLEKFSQLMNLHEQKVSNFLAIPTVKEKFFENCPSFVKSLGAWGGDFVMSSKFEGYNDYFSGKGFSVIMNWDDIIAS